MKKHNRIWAFVCVLGLLPVLLSGCAVGDTHIFVSSGCGIHDVFKIGSMTCSQKEAKVYLMNYKNLYGVVCDYDLWDGAYDTKTMERSLKDAVLEHLTRIYAMNLYAKDQGITLDDRELQAASDAADAYYDSLTKEERSYCGASAGDIRDMYERYVLAQKVYTGLMDGVDSEVSEDEARIMDADIIFVTDAAKAVEVENKLAAGADFETLAASYNELGSVQVSFGRGEYPAEVETVAFSLDNGQMSGKIVSSDGYYFVTCVNKYNRELSEENKAAIIANRKQEAVENIISSLETKYYAELNESLWKKLALSKGNQLKTDSFFAQIESQL